MRVGRDPARILDNGGKTGRDMDVVLEKTGAGLRAVKKPAPSDPMARQAGEFEPSQAFCGGWIFEFRRWPRRV